jgi:hypothetical protein
VKVRFDAELVDELPQYGPVLVGHVFELHPATPHTDLLPGRFRNFMIINHFARNAVEVNETLVAPEYCYGRIITIGQARGQVTKAKTPQADISDLPHVDQPIGHYESRKGAFFDFEPFEFSFFFGHCRSGQKVIPCHSRFKKRETG